MGSSDGRQRPGHDGANAAGAAADISPEDAERFASVLRPMWELEPTPPPPFAAPNTANPGANPFPTSVTDLTAEADFEMMDLPGPDDFQGSPRSAPRSAPMSGPASAPMSPVVPTTPLHAHPQPVPPHMAPPQTFGNQAPQGFPGFAPPGNFAAHAPPAPAFIPQTQPQPPAFVAPPVPARVPQPEPAPENPNAYAVRAHRPPPRQAIEHASSSIEVEPAIAPVQAQDFGPPRPEVYGPSEAEQAAMVARQRRHQPTLMIRPGQAGPLGTGSFPLVVPKSRKPMIVLAVVAAVVVLLAAGVLYKLSERSESSATSPSGSPSGTTVVGTGMGTSAGTTMPDDVPPPAPSAMTAPAPTDSSAPASAAVDPNAAASAAAAGKPGARPPATRPTGHGKPANGGIVRKSPF